ncbi:MAG: alanine/glycine:cation symporter family protein [Lachnospiraceae bacterium]
MEKINSILWGPAMLLFFLAVGLLFSIRTRFFQLFHIRDWLENTLFAMMKRKEVRKTDEKTAISQFQSLCTALAATLGTGNIAGVATAIVTGGPGSIFWMWVSAVLGSMTNFAEKTLGVHYRYKNRNGEWTGGPMIYMEKGLHSKIMAILFSFFCIVASLGIGNMSQSNSVSTALESSCQIPASMTGIVLLILIAFVIMGGVKRIASLTEKLVPFMALLYTAGALVAIGMHINRVPSAFHSIITEAFRFSSVGGGVLGYGMNVAVRKGISRGVFSNEAGLGSSVMIHSASDVKEPVIQGMWGILEVFIDTIVMCTLTALVILTSGVYEQKQCLLDMSVGNEVLNGVPLTAASFEQSFGTFGGVFISISVVLFAFSTIVGWSFYGCKAVEYLFGFKAIQIYKIVYLISIYLGAVMKIELVWNISDAFNACMAIPNLIALTLLSDQVIEMFHAYKKNRNLS